MNMPEAGEINAWERREAGECIYNIMREEDMGMRMKMFSGRRREQ